jgi:poly-beta-1,6-N-acetyl-D-glucosamine synthase
MNLEQPNVSIVIACRNEENNIINLLDSLAKQSYPKDKTEIIIVDDHSEDETEKIIRNNSTSSIQLLNLPKDISGKKAALRYGINLAQSDIIITTDADCWMNENWILSLVNYYLHYKPKLLVAPVVFEPQNNLFQKFQSLEFLSLMGSGAGAIGINRPIMCNGANLLFEKSIYENAVHNNNYASGDDIFLMLHTKKEFRKEIHFIKSTEAIVYTKPTQSVNEFFRQRIRWASKSKGYRDFDVLFSALIVALSNLFLVLFLLASAFRREFLLFFLFAFIVKSIFDLILLIPVSRFFNQQKLLWLIIPLQIIYPFYIVFTAFAGLVGKFSWKNRSFR